MSRLGGFVLSERPSIELRPLRTVRYGIYRKLYRLLCAAANLSYHRRLRFPRLKGNTPQKEKQR